MASPGQKRGSCGHAMALFDNHSRCACCREKGQGQDPCVLNRGATNQNITNRIDPRINHCKPY